MSPDHVRCAKITENDLDCAFGYFVLPVYSGRCVVLHQVEIGLNVLQKSVSEASHA